MGALRFRVCLEDAVCLHGVRQMEVEVGQSRECGTAHGKERGVTKKVSPWLVWFLGWGVALCASNRGLRFLIRAHA